MWLDNLRNEGERARRLRNDLEFFAKHCLKIRTKTGELQPLIFNDAQRKLNQISDEQLTSG